MSIRDFPQARRVRWRAEPGAAAETLPDITIVTPCLNRAGLIGAMLESVAAQGYPRLRHIVVDGGSADGTLDVLARHPAAEVVHQVSRGSHEAMNEGLPLVRSPVITFVNTDDLLLPGALLAAGRAFAADPGLDALRLRAALFGAIEGDQILAEGEIVEPAPADRLRELLYGTPGFNGWFFRTEVLRRLGGFDTAFDVAGDREMLLRLYLGGARIEALPVLGYAYRRHPGSRTLDHAAQLRFGILADHVAVARKHLGAARGTARATLAAWHAFETARLALQYVKADRVLDAARLALGALVADPSWPFRIGAGRRDAAALARSVTTAPAADVP